MAAIKKNTLLLDNNAIEEDFFEYAFLYGFRFSEEAYHCAWYLNNYLGTDFIRNKNFFTNNQHGFDLYEYFDKRTSIEHLLYSNHQQGNYMIRELKGYQYFWLVKGEENALFYMNTVQQKLKKIAIAIDVQSIDFDKVKDKNLFIF